MVNYADCICMFTFRAQIVLKRDLLASNWRKASLVFVLLPSFKQAFYL